MALRVALVGGPMYDRLYDLLDDVEIVVHADHPTLNHEVASMLERSERIDVLSTHSKYAPSQAAWLRPLDVDVTGLASRAIDLCTFDGDLLSVPRCIDVRVLWMRDDIHHTPMDWDELASSSVVFGFPGRESGLFGTFFEIVTSLGGRLFDEDARPVIDSPEAVDAVELLCALAKRAPSDLPEWHYDQVDQALLDGRIDAAAAWPGGYGAIRDSGLPLIPHPYVGGVSYAGVHSWAIPTTCGDVDGARALIEKLAGEEAGRLDASVGTIPANDKALASIEPANEIDARRLAITRDTIRDAMITYPPLPRFPEVEDAGWQAINQALRGALSAPAAVTATQEAAERALS